MRKNGNLKETIVNESTKLSKIMIDARTLPEIWSSLTKFQQAEISARVIKQSLVTESAWRNWRTGHRRPEPVHQMTIIKVLKSVLKIQTTPETLFPKYN